MSIPWQGMPVFFPLLLSPIGIILAFVSIKTNKRCALYGIVLNAIMFPFPFFGLSEGLCYLEFNPLGITLIHWYFRTCQKKE